MISRKSRSCTRGRNARQNERHGDDVPRGGFIMLFGKVSAKKPTHYCALHKCGVAKGCCKRRCWVCKYLKNVNAEIAREIRTG